MSKKDSQRGAAVINVLKSDSMVSVGKEYLEVGIDSVLESGILKDIPFVNSVVGVFNAAGSVRDHILATKVLRFLNELAEIGKNERIDLVEKLNEDDKFAGRAGAAVIEMLDRMESDRKPELAAKCFAAFARTEISFDDLRRLVLALERIPSFDIKKLPAFSEAGIEGSLQMDQGLLLAFVTAGLGVNNGGLDGGAIVPTNLCRLFLKLGLAD
jgi:hypothetical protein